MPADIKMREMVQGGELGELRRVNWIITNWFRTQQYYDQGGWRATWAGEGGGVLTNQCPHNLDLLQCALRHSPRSISIWLASFSDSPCLVGCQVDAGHDAELDQVHLPSGPPPRHRG